MISEQTPDKTVRTDVNLLENAVGADVELETLPIGTKNFASDAKKARKKRDEAFHDAIFTFVREKDEKNLITALRLFGDKTVKCPLLEGKGRETDTSGLEKTADATSEEVARLDHLKGWLIYSKAVSGDDGIYKDRNHWLEKAIRIFRKFFDVTDDPIKWQSDYRPSGWPP